MLGIGKAVEIISDIKDGLGRDKVVAFPEVLFFLIEENSQVRLTGDDGEDDCPGEKDRVVFAFVNRSDEPGARGSVNHFLGKRKGAGGAPISNHVATFSILKNPAAKAEDCVFLPVPEQAGGIDEVNK